MRNVFFAVMGIAGVVLSGCGGEAAGRVDGDEAGAAGEQATEQQAGQGGDAGSSENGGRSNLGPDAAGEAGVAGEPSAGEGSEPPDGSQAGTASATGGSAAAGSPASGGPGPIGTGGVAAPIDVPPIAVGPGGVQGPPPENCEPAGETGSEGYCEVQLACDNDSVYTYCYDEGNGRWNCECGSNYRYQTFEVEGVDVASACETVSELCSSAEEPEFTEPETCTTEYLSQSADYCETELQCGESVELGDGVTATRNTWKYASCYDQGGDGLYCDCSNGETYRTYQITGQSVGGSCQLALDLCASGDELEFDGPKMCETQYQSVGTGYCDTELQCTQSAEVSENVTALLVEWQYASCQDLQNGKSSCGCYGETGELRFDVDDSTTDSNTCSNAIDICSSIDDLELSGDQECERVYQSASGQWCDAQVACGQDATLGDQELFVYGDLYLNCQFLGEDGWTCSCNSAADSASLHIDASVEGWDACTQASEQCPDLVEVTVGGGGPFVGGGFGGPRPVPL